MNHDLLHKREMARTMLHDGTARAANGAIELLREPGAPNDGESCALLGRAYFLRGDARGDVYSGHFFSSRAMELGSRDDWILAIRAICAFRKEQHDEAAEIFSAYVTEDSAPATQCMRGLAHLYSGAVDEAVTWIDRALESDPENPEFRDARKRVEAVRRGETVRERPLLDLRKHWLGGVDDDRPLDQPSPYAFNALSKLKGVAAEPKDFDWLDRNIPCQKACPARTDIPGYLKAIYRGEYHRAYRINLCDNVFPAILGRVCSRPCEAACRHGWDGLGEPVAICFSKRSAADLRENRDPVVLDPWCEKSGKSVAVVGAGVAGLAAARNLALLGHRVVVYEKHNRPGGMLNQGIPKFRLPWEHIDREIEQITRLGVDIVCNTHIGRDLPLQTLVDEYEAVILAAGTLRPNMLNLPGSELKGIRHGLDFLLEANEQDHADVGEHVVVIGGGFTAMDCARTARRLGAHAVEATCSSDTPWTVDAAMKLKGETVRVSYRRSKGEMLVTPGELEELEHEGIPMDFMVSPVAFLGEGGHVTAMRFVRTELGEPDPSGRRRPVRVKGTEFEIPADTVLLATGQFPDTSWIDASLADQLVADDQWLKSGERQVTAHQKIFVAGDFATGARTLIEAIAHGKDAARAVDTALMGEERLQDVALVEDVRETGRIREMDFVDRRKMPTLPLDRRTLTGEVEQGYDPGLAVDETQRCYFCHYKYEIDTDKCIYCDWCIKAKPRPQCIVKVAAFEYDEAGRITGWREASESEETQAIWINQEDCIRCNACVNACPVDCISIQQVSRQQQKRGGSPFLRQDGRGRQVV